MMSDLPKERLPFNEQPFTHTAIDYFGPINVKLIWKRRSNQVTFDLFTHAFHLELGSGLSTDILAIKRFNALCGKPKEILWELRKAL